MRVIKWTNEFALGIEEIDEQHRALVGMINALDPGTHGDPGSETIRRLLAELSDYASHHFAFEERLMGGGGCSPDLIARHFSEHAYFRSLLKDLTTDFEKGRRNITVPLIEYLVHWFLHHIAVVDRVMAHELNVAEPELAARVAAALMQNVTDDLTDSERHLLGELRRTNEELERQVQERTQALTEKNHKLEAELREMTAIIEQMRAEQAPPPAAQ